MFRGGMDIHLKRCKVTQKCKHLRYTAVCLLSGHTVSLEEKSFAHTLSCFSSVQSVPSQVQLQVTDM